MELELVVEWEWTSSSCGVQMDVECKLMWCASGCGVAVFYVVLYYFWVLLK